MIFCWSGICFLSWWRHESRNIAYRQLGCVGHSWPSRHSSFLRFCVGHQSYGLVAEARLLTVLGSLIFQAADPATNSSLSGHVLRKHLGQDLRLIDRYSDSGSGWQGSSSGHGQQKATYLVTMVCCLKWCSASTGCICRQSIYCHFFAGVRCSRS